MSEVLAQLEKKGGGSLIFDVTAAGNNGAEQYANTTIPPQNLYHKLKIVEYKNLSYTVSTYPRILIDSTEYQRPTIGTEFDITNKDVTITAYANTNGWKQTGVKVELS